MEPSAAHEQARALVDAMTPDEQLWCLDGDLPAWAGLADLSRGGYHRRPFPAARVERLELPGFAFSDGPRGVVVDRATAFPVSMARGATWDPDLEERIGDAIGRELRAVGADLFGGVCVNVLRHPAWGRAQETYGEDPFLVGEMGAALTRGVQRHAMACVKHFACNSMENARFKVDVEVDEVALHEVYLPHFRRIVAEGVACVMSAYNQVNGDWCGESRPLLTDVLRGEWGFDGFVISDWLFGLRDAAASLRGGLDVEMPYRMARAGALPAALEAGEVSWAEVASAAEHVVSTRLRFDEVLDSPRPGYDVLACDDHHALAREVAARSVVLLRNEPVDGRPVLPLDLSALQSVAVLGELAAVVNLGDGGSSDVWAPSAVTVLDGIQAALPEASVEHDAGDDVDRAAALAARADVAVVVVGYTHQDEGEYIGAEGTGHLSKLLPGPDDPALVAAFEAFVAQDRTIEPPEHVTARDSAVGFTTGGDRSSLRLRPEHVALVTSVAAANPRTVVAVVGGSAVVMAEWDHLVPAVLQSWYAGMEGGHGLADVLLGRTDPSGRLPFSIPTTEAHLPAFDRDADHVVYDAWHGWWLLQRDGHAPAYPFGFGLGYTTFTVVGTSVATVGDGLQVTGTVHNTGSRHGTDVVQVYAERVGGRPRLVGFRRVEVEPGQEVPFTIDVPATTLVERDVTTHRMVVHPGRYRVRIARHAGDPGTVLDVELVAPADR
jgi:beta-glucosidase